MPMELARSVLVRGETRLLNALGVGVAAIMLAVASSGDFAICFLRFRLSFSSTSAPKAPSGYVIGVPTCALPI